MPRIESSADGPIHLLVYSRFKTGKTAGAATAPRPNFILCDPNGLDTVRTKWWVNSIGSPEQLTSIQYAAFAERKRTALGVVASHNALDDACRYFDACMTAGGRKWKDPSTGKEWDVHPDSFDTWVLDSMTSLSEFSANKAAILAVMGSKTQSSALSTGLLIPVQQDYLAERSMTEQFVDMLLDSGKNVIILCHEKEINDKAGNLVERVPLLTGQSVERVCIKFTEIYRLSMKKKGDEVVRSLQTEPDLISKCGSRLGVKDGTEWTWQAVTKAISAARFSLPPGPQSAAPASPPTKP